MEVKAKFHSELVERPGFCAVCGKRVNPGQRDASTYVYTLDGKRHYVPVHDKCAGVEKVLRPYGWAAVYAPPIKVTIIAGDIVPEWQEDASRRGIRPRVNVRDFLERERWARQGQDPFGAVLALLEALKVPLPPTRYEVRVGRGIVFLEAVLEIDGQEVDREILDSGDPWDKEALEEVAKHLNAVPMRERRPVRFFPYAEVETRAILDDIHEVVATIREKRRGHPLRGVVGDYWRPR